MALPRNARQTIHPASLNRVRSVGDQLAERDASCCLDSMFKKYKELMAIAVALTTQCLSCIEIHADAARKAGVSEEELAEAGFVAAALRAGATVTHATHLIKD